MAAPLYVQPDEADSQVVSLVGVLPFALPSNASGPQWGVVTGWAPMAGYISQPQQIGMFAGQLLNQYPAMLPGVQRHSGREWGNSRWQTPSKTPTPNGNLQLSQTPAQLAGGQRYGSLFSGPIGPVSARKNAAAVTRAQVQQSGLASLAWAQQLSEQ